MAEQQKVSDAQATSAVDFARIRVMNADISKSDATRADAACIASITTLAGLQAELKAWNERRARLANDNQLDDSTARKMLGEREILVAKLANFEAGLRGRANAQEAEFHAQVKARMVEEFDWVNTQVAKFKELYDIQQKRIQLQEEYQRSLATAGKEQENQTAMTAVQEQEVAEREAAISRMRATGIIEIQVKGQVSKKYSGRNCET